jgi:peptide/nickel transport system permease protein
VIKYVAWRAVAVIPLLIVVGIIAFGLVAALELRGSAADYILQDASASPELVEQMEAQLGLDKPLPTRFGEWLLNAAQGDFGTSLVRPNLTVSSLIGVRIWPTLSIAAFGIAFGAGFGILLGVLSGVRAGGRGDRAISLLSAFLMSTPAFVVGFLLIIVFAVQLGWFQPTGYSTPARHGWWMWLKSITLPGFALGLPIVAVVQRQLRGSMTAALQSPYVLAARARGVPSGTIIRRHALRNAMLPTITVIAFWAAAAIGLTTAVEVTFNVPGMSSLMVDGILSRDLPVVQGCLMVSALIATIINLCVDLSYAWLNPRIRLT